MSSQSPTSESVAGPTAEGNPGSVNGGDMGRDGEKGGRLTEEEKKNNHIASEQKRRMAIREGFDKLSTIVPGLEGQARSEALVLRSTVNYMEKALMERRQLIIDCDRNGIPVDPQMRNEIDRLLHWEEYKRNKPRKPDSSEGSGDEKKFAPGPKKRTTSTSR
ncbi:hypothetical protein V8F33_002853 [Rhypophila sp. PSN 637]